MCAHRQIFGKCVVCFNRQPWSGGAEPDGFGPRSRTWWFTEAIGKLPWYVNYFMRQTIDAYVAGEAPDWCKIPTEAQAHGSSAKPDKVYCNGADATVLNYSGGTTYLFLKAPQLDMQYLHLFYNNLAEPSPPEYPIYINMYRVSDDWECSTLTWNNKPALGPFISRLVIEDRDYSWRTLPTGGAKAVCLLTTGYPVRIYFRGVIAFGGMYPPSFS